MMQRAYFDRREIYEQSSGRDLPAFILKL